MKLDPSFSALHKLLPWGLKISKSTLKFLEGKVGGTGHNVHSGKDFLNRLQVTQI